MTRTSGKRIFVSAGELSGEQHAAALVTSLRALAPDLVFEGYGGATLAAAGVELRYPLSDHAVMGLAAVLAELPRFIGVLDGFDRLLEESRPDAVVLVDYPGLHLRMAKLAKARGVPVAYYVCPQLWAWAPWRARRFARCVDLALTILPFEEAYFERLGIEARFVGHPSADDVLARPPAGAALRGSTIALLPGSRRQEVLANLPVLLAAAKRLLAREPSLRFVLPQASPRARALCETLLAERGAPPVTLHETLDPALADARFAFVASGTATFEVALRAIPLAVLYRVRPASARIGKQLLTVPWISQVNLIAGGTLVPELVTTDAPEVVAAELVDAAWPLIEDGRAREDCIAGLVELRRHAHPSDAPASAVAAAAILALLGRGTAETIAIGGSSS